MNDTSTVSKCNIISKSYKPSFSFVFIFNKIKKWFIESSFKIFTLLCFNFFIFFRLEQSFNQSISHNIIFIANFDFCIIFFCIHTKSNVWWKCPRSCCPSKIICIFFIKCLKLSINSSIFNILIPLSNFVTWKRCCTSWAVRNNSVTLINQTFFVHFTKCPPLRFDVFIFISYISIVSINRITHSIRKLFPHILIFPNTFTAIINKRLNSICFNILFSCRTNHFFNFKFNWKPVGIPTSLSQNILTLHCLITQEYIFDCSS